MDINPIAQAATDTLSYLWTIGEDAINKEANKLAGAGIGTLVNLIKNKFTSAGQKEALNDLQTSPSDEDNKELFLAQLKKALKNDPEFANRLKELLEKDESIQPVVQKVKAGDNAKIIQQNGQTNTATIN